MSKLDEIKRRYPHVDYVKKLYEEKTQLSDGSHESDVEYLLYLLEIAEEALGKVNHRSSTYHEFESTHEVLSDVRKRSIEALQQLRS